MPSSNSNNLEPIPNDSQPNAEHTPPFSQSVFDRLNNRVQQTGSVTEPQLQRQLLETLGYHLRQWRLRRGYNRQQLADKLHWDGDLILCVESGIALPEDFSQTHALTLSSLVEADTGGCDLLEALRSYLASQNH